MGADTKSLYGMWMWQTPLLRVVVSFMVLVPILVGCILYPFLGVMAFVAFPFAGIGLINGLVYGAIGKRVERLRQSIDLDEGEAVDGLIVNGYIQSPGIVVLKNSEIELLPIVGEAIAIPLANISAVRERHCFNGTYYWCKTGFVLTVPGKKHLGFAIGNTLAEKWRDFLSPAEKARCS